MNFSSLGQFSNNVPIFTQQTPFLCSCLSSTLLLQKVQLLLSMEESSLISRTFRFSMTGTRFMVQGPSTINFSTNLFFSNLATLRLVSFTTVNLRTGALAAATMFLRRLIPVISTMQRPSSIKLGNIADKAG